METRGRVKESISLRKRARSPHVEGQGEMVGCSGNQWVGLEMEIEGIYAGYANIALQLS